ncbi:MAG: hypothetical protein Kow0029_20800 [Candidatus Rifleibacteriota bacterium]
MKQFAMRVNDDRWSELRIFAGDTAIFDEADKVTDDGLYAVKLRIPSLKGLFIVASVTQDGQEPLLITDLEAENGFPVDDELIQVVGRLTQTERDFSDRSGGGSFEI